MVGKTHDQAIDPKKIRLCAGIPGGPEWQPGGIPGYSARNADKIGSELLGKTRVRAEIQVLMDKRAEKVNAGAVSRKLAQLVVGQTPDGQFGDKTVQALNQVDPAKFVSIFALAKIARYRDIVTKNRTQQKFLLGWINRTLQGVA